MSYSPLPNLQSQPPEILFSRLDAKLLYDSDTNFLHEFTFNAMLLTSLIEGFGGQTSKFCWFSNGGWFITLDTMIGWAWALSRREPVNETLISLGLN